MQLSFSLPLWGNMEAVQKEHWYFLVLFVFLSFLKVAVQQKGHPITVRLEEGMILECLCPWEGSLIMVAWTKDSKRPPVAVYDPVHGLSFSHRYKERVEFLKTTPMDGSIVIRNVTHQDIGVYHCSIHTFPNGSWSREVQVEDQDEAPEYDLTESPVPEEIQQEVVAELHSNLTLRCDHPPHNGSAHRVTMEKLTPAQTWGDLARCATVEDGRLPVSKVFTVRGLVTCTEGLNVSLHLSDVLEEDQGFYRCRFTTESGEWITTTRVSVQSLDGFSLSAYMMYVYIGSGLAGLILIVITIFILAVRHRRRNKRVEYRVKLHPSQKQANYYMKTSKHTRMGKKPNRKNDCPVYANIQNTHHKTMIQL